MEVLSLGVLLVFASFVTQKSQYLVTITTDFHKDRI